LVLNELNIDIERGKTNVILGASGSGKTVLVKILMCLLRPEAGTVQVDGVDIFSLKQEALTEFRSKCGLVFQFSALFDSLTVEENCAFPLRERGGKSRSEIQDIVNDRLAALGLDGTQRKYPSELSGGMRKRAGLARALVLDPEVLFFDEPTTGLDPLATKNVDDLIVATAARYPVTIVVISHDLSSVFRIADRISILLDKKVLASGTVDEFLSNTHPYLRAFVDTSGVSASLCRYRDSMPRSNVQFATANLDAQNATPMPAR
jgi:phospholipid/cholesterol/gamma-HCH transport system ATP-binding protein